MYVRLILFFVVVGFFCFVFLFSFLCIKCWTQSLTHARQMLYHWGILSVPFYKEESLGFMLLFTNIKIYAQLLRDRMRNLGLVTSCFAFPSGESVLLHYLQPCCSWKAIGKLQAWLAASSTTVQESTRPLASGSYLVTYPQRRTGPLGQAVPIQLVVVSNSHNTFSF